MQFLKKILVVTLAVIMTATSFSTIGFAIDEADETPGVEAPEVETPEVEAPEDETILVEDLSLNATKITWTVGKAGHFKPIILPENAENKTLEWSSSNPAVATVNENGKLTAVSKGSAIITCKTTDGSNLEANCVVVVNNILVKTLKLNTSKLNWYVGKSASFKATITPTNATNPTLKWTSSNSKVAKVDATGKLTAVSKGSATITCSTTDGSNLKATCSVTVNPFVKVNSLKLNATKINWPVGKAGSFKPTLAPSNASVKTLKWTSSNTSVATVDANGKLTAVKAGSATITCKTTDGSNLSATCKVTVYNVKAQKLTLNTNKISWFVGKSGYFKPTVTPSNTTNPKLEWYSSNEEVATVNQNGKLTAVKKGTAIITCETTDGSNLSATCRVTVKNIEVEKLTLSAKNIRWNVGKAGRFTATIEPANATIKTLKWVSSNENVATISQDGRLVAVGFGKAVITCRTTDGSGVYAQCNVIVHDPDATPVESLKLNTNKITWRVGQSGTFKPTVEPSYATNKTLQWSTSDSDVVIINDKGYIKAIGEGKAVITCETTDGSDIKVTCDVTVLPAIETEEDYEGSGLLGFAWDTEQKCFFSSKNSWQRNFGFCEEYDIAAPLTVMYYDTVRVKFHYADKDWMIQTWKGQYGIFVGCEIGVYYKDPDSNVEFYDCVADEDLLYMDATLYWNGEKQFTRKYDKYWWITGFKTGVLRDITDRTPLMMNSTVTFPTVEMMDAFLEAFEAKDFHLGEDYWVCGKSVTFNWQYQKDPLKES